MNISVQSIIHLHLLKCRLKLLGIFLRTAPLLGHLIMDFKMFAITGNQDLRMFDTVLSETLNLYAISLLLSPNLSFIRTTNK